MYQPLGEATIDIEKYAADIPNGEAATIITRRAPPSPPGAKAPTNVTSLYVLTVVMWITCIIFGLFSLVHYLIPGLQGNPQVWDTTDPGLNRLPKRQPTANVLMMIHWVGGIYIMAVGPLQLVPWFRRNHINLHRWMGRFYIIGALLVGGGAAVFTVVYGTSRGWLHENIGNFLQGASTVICAVQSYRCIKQGNIEQHKLWSWRLFAVALSAITYRLYAVLYFGLVLFTPWQGSVWINNLSYYVCLGFANLLLVELLAKHDWEPMRWVLRLAIAIVVLTTVAASLFSWLPAMMGIQTNQGNAFEEVGGGEGER